ncbi:MAG: fatty acid desaturase [Bacteroidota bacterium]
MALVVLVLLVAGICNIRILKYHVLVMLFGESFSAFFAVWTVHHDLEEKHLARTMRSGWKNLLTYNMFYHLEHHLFPAVPTIKLPELARRIDKEVPELVKKSVF